MVNDITAGVRLFRWWAQYHRDVKRAGVCYNYANYRCDERKYNMEIERAIKRRLHMIETIRESGGSGYLTKMTLLII